jgi:hypothetical protein
VEGDQLSPKPSRGLLARLFGRSQRVNVTVRRSEQLNLSVPTANADAVRSAVERWLADRGVSVAVDVEDEGEGKSRIRTTLGEADAAKIVFSAEDVQVDLQKVLFDALR